MRRWLQGLAPVVLAGGLILLPVVAGRLLVSASLLVVAWVAVSIGLLGVAALRPEATTAPPGPPTPGKRKGKTREAQAAPVPAPPPAPGAHFDAADWVLGAFVLLSLLPTVASVYRFASLVYGLKVIAAALLFWAVRYGLGEARWRRGVLWALVAGGAVASVWGLREYVRTVWFLGDAEWRIFGSFQNPNCLAGYLLLTTFPAAALLFGSQTRAARRTDEGAPRYPEIAALFALGLMVVALLLTGSKAAFAAFLVGMVVFGLLAAGCAARPRLVRGLVLLGVGAMIVGALALPPLRARLLSAFGWQSHSAQFRTYTWQGTLGMIRERPLLGFGGGTFEHAFPRFAIAGFTRQAHQSFLQIAAETGVPSLLMGLVWGGLLLAGLWRQAQRRESGLLARLTAAAVLAGMVASAVQELADYAWYVPAVGASFFALAGLGLGSAAVGPEVHGQVTAPAATRWLGGRVAVGAVVVSMVLLLAVLPLAVGEGLGSAADRLAAEQEYPAAAAVYARAAAWNPWQARLHVQRSKVLEAMAGHDRNMLAQAVQARLAAIQRQPTEPLNYVALSRLYLQAGDNTSAVQAAQAALKWYPNYPRGLVQLAAAQEAAGEHDLALRTYRQLAALYATPVGQCPALEGLAEETAYAAAWIALGAHADRGGDHAQAEQWYARATGMLVPALNADRGLQAQSDGALDFSQGRLVENSALARRLREQLAGKTDLTARYRVAQLTVALGETDEARRRLGELLASLAAPRDDYARRVQAWATLQLAQELTNSGQQEEGRQVAAKGLALAAKLPVFTPPAAGPWREADEGQLTTLRQWATKMLARRASELGSAEPA